MLDAGVCFCIKHVLTDASSFQIDDAENILHVLQTYHKYKSISPWLFSSESIFIAYLTPKKSQELMF